MSSSSSSSFSESDTSQSRIADGSSKGTVLVIEVLADAGPEPAVEDVPAVAEAKDDPALGSWGSGVMLVKIVSQAPPPASGVRLRSRSPKPSREAWRDALSMEIVDPSPLISPPIAMIRSDNVDLPGRYNDVSEMY